MTKASKLRELQLVELDILLKVVTICNDFNLTYYISGGTLLGAVRHKGFIPWDDDIDIAMPRKDYEKFRTIASKKLPSGYLYRNFKNDTNLKICFSRVENSSVQVKDTSARISEIRNAWIDIFPLDGVPNNRLLRVLYKYKLLYLRLMVQYSQFSRIVNQNLPNRKIHERILIRIGGIFPFEKIICTRKYMNKLDTELQRYSNNSDYYMNFLGIYKFSSVMKKEEIYQEGAEYEFEGHLFRGPKDFDKYLTQIYGNYMKLPPIEHRNKHHTEVIYE